MVDVPLPAVIGELAVTVDWAADTTPALSAIVRDVAGPSGGALKLSVRSPAVPLIDRLVKVATPPLFVIAVNAWNMKWNIYHALVLEQFGPEMQKRFYDETAHPERV